MANSLMEKLMKLDRDRLLEVPTEKVKACYLSKVAGENVEVTIKALSGNRYTELASSATNKAGGIDASKIYDTHARVVVAGCVEPDLRDKDLMEHYKAVTPKELAQILFPGGDLVKISERIRFLSGFGKENESDEGVEYEDVKNS
nr:MAG TPA: tail assembly chaperone protein [Caudoviricetes sp.]